MAGGNEALLVALSDRAAAGVDWHAGTHWSLRHRDPDGDRWVEVGRFPTRKIASITRDALVGDGHGTKDDFRVTKVKISLRA